MKIIKSIQKVLTPDLLVGQWKKDKVAHPLEGHCYIAAEAAYHLVGKSQDYKPVMLNHAIWPEGLNKGETHWFLRAKDGQVIDPTQEQFLGLTIPYALGRPCGFLTKLPSKRARIVIERSINLQKEFNEQFI